MGLFSFLFGSCFKKSENITSIEVDTHKKVGAMDEPKVVLTESTASRFHPGQVWAFTPPAGQPEARLTILRVEDGAKAGRIVHISLSGVKYGGGHTHIQHLPLAEAAIEKSVTSLDRKTGPIPDFSEGYKQWRTAFDAGKGGVFTISVAEAFDFVTSVIEKKP